MVTSTYGNDVSAVDQTNAAVAFSNGLMHDESSVLQRTVISPRRRTRKTMTSNTAAILAGGSRSQTRLQTVNFGHAGLNTSNFAHAGVSATNFSISPLKS